MRKEFDVKSTLERNDVLTSEAAKLKYLAENFKIPVLVRHYPTGISVALAVAQRPP